MSRSWTEGLHSGSTVREAGPGYTHYALAGWGGPGDGWRLHGAHGQLLVFGHDAVVTLMADDHLGADDMAARVEQAIRAEVGAGHD